MIQVLILPLLLLQTPGYTVERDVVFATVAGEPLKMDVFRPEKPVRQPVPAVVALHGGAWVGGKRSDMDAISIELVKQGVLVVASQYRLAPRFKYPAQLDDAQTAVRYLRAESKKLGIDGNRIGAVGVSAGAHLALFLGATDDRKDPFKDQSSRVKAVVTFAAPTDLSKEYPAALDPIYQMVLGKKKEEAHEEVRRGSPVNFVDRRSAPAFFLHGTADQVVPFAQLGLIVDRYKEHKIRHEAVAIEGASHAVIDKPEGVRAAQRALTWLVEELKR